MIGYRICPSDLLNFLLWFYRQKYIFHNQFGKCFLYQLQLSVFYINFTNTCIQLDLKYWRPTTLTAFPSFQFLASPPSLSFNGAAQFFASALKKIQKQDFHCYKSSIHFRTRNEWQVPSQLLPVHLC